MKIANAAVAMRGDHVRAERHQERGTLRAWVGRQRPDFETPHGRRPEPPPPPVQISAAAESARATEADAIRQADEAAQRDPFLLLLKAVLEWMTGEPVDLFDRSRLPSDAPPPAMPAQAAPAAPTRAGYGVEYDYRVVHEEFEQSDFSAHGVVHTADGRAIRFRLELTMARSYREETNVSLRAGDGVRKDPLVVNFGGTAAQLSSRRFKFDLDADGKTEDVPLLTGASGYLALDVNGNGRIDSGAELFGPADSSGFAALARHDDDGNGWIDENDAVFNRLRVWTPAAGGAGRMATLKERDVGALYLGHAATPFELRGDANQDLGAVRAGGIYVTEAGTVGGLQEIDLTI